LYLVYEEAMIREATDNMETGNSVGSRTPSHMQMTRQWWLTVIKVTTTNR